MKKYFVFALIIGVSAAALSFVPTTQAASLTQGQIDAIISLLQSFGADQTVVNNVQTALGRTPTVPPTLAWCHTFNTNLGMGSQSSEVDALLTALGKEELNVGNIGIRGATYYDEYLASAVSGFQQKYADEILTPLGLKYGTGYVGKSTRAKLNQLYGCNKPTPPPFCSFSTSITCESGSKVLCPAGLDDKGCPLPCKCVPSPVPVPPIACTAPACLAGYTLYDTGQKDNNGCPIKKCIPPTSNQPPVISGVSGQTTLKVNETGTWTVRASDPEQRVLSYSVRWGDETTTGLYAPAQRARSYTQSATFTHSFSKAGAYNPTFTVTDDKGLSAKTSISVQVGEVQTEAKPDLVVKDIQFNPNPATVGKETVISFRIVNEGNTSVVGGITHKIESSAASSRSIYDDCITNVGLSPGAYCKVQWGLTYSSATISTSGAVRVDSQGTISELDETNNTTTFRLSVVSAITPSITVLSPNGGETWEIGKNYNIKWSSTEYGLYGGKPVDINLLSYIGPGNYPVVMTIAASLKYTDSYGWTIPSSINPGAYVIRVSSAVTGEVISDLSDSYFKIVSAPSITVLSPNNSSVSLVPGQIFQISWKISGVTLQQSSGAGVQIQLLDQNQNLIGQTAGLVCLVCSSNNDGGYYNWTVPSGLLSGQYYIKIATVGGSIPYNVQDMSDAPFSIVAATQPLTALSAEIIGSQSTYTSGQTIKFSVKGVASDGSAGTPAKGFNVQAWMQTTNPIATVQINGAYQSFNANYNSSTGYWDVVMTAPSDTSQTYKIEAAFYCSNSSAGCSSGQINKSFTFTVTGTTQPSITVLSPNGGESWRAGYTYDVKWTNTSGKNVRIELIKGNNFVTSWGPIYSTVSTYNILLATSLQAGSDYKIRVGSLDASNAYDGVYYDDSDAAFSIVAAGVGAYITIDYPLSGSTINNKNFSVGGRCVNYNGTVKVYYYSDKKEETLITCANGSWSANISLVTNAISGSFDLFAETIQGTQAKINVKFDFSTTPSITVLSPNGGESWRAGYTYDVKWTNTSGKNVRIELIKGNNFVTSWGPIYSTVSTYNILLATSLQAGSDYKIRVGSLDASNAYDGVYYDDSDAAFSIVAAAVGQISEIDQIASVLWSMKQVMSHTVDAVVVEAMKKVMGQLEETLNKLKNQ